MSKRQWIAAAGTAWLVLAVYLGTMLLLIRRYQPKVATEGLDIAERDALYTTLGGRLYQAFAPVWAHNRYVVPFLLVVAIGASVVAWSGGRRREAAT
jgi:hypothetical protein